MQNQSCEAAFTLQCCAQVPWRLELCIGCTIGDSMRGMKAFNCVQALQAVESWTVKSAAVAKRRSVKRELQRANACPPLGASQMAAMAVPAALCTGARCTACDGSIDEKPGRLMIRLWRCGSSHHTLPKQGNLGQRARARTLPKGPRLEAVVVSAALWALLGIVQ